MLTGYTNIDAEKVKKYASENPTWTKEHWADYFCPNRNRIPLSGTGRVMDPIGDRRDAGIFYGLLSHLSETVQKMEVYMKDDFAAVVGYNGKRFVLPSEFVSVVPLTDYSSVTGSRLKIALIGKGGSRGMMLPDVPGESGLEIRKKKSETEKSLLELAEEEKAIKDCTSSAMADLKKQLDELKRKIEERQKQLMEELKKKQDELAKKKRELEKELFILETQIYGIRCYLGETVSFYTVRGGDPAPKDAPIVIYQKIRFLDEELGKHLALFAYGAHEDDKEQLLSVLKYRDDIADLLCPGPKSISVAKISRTGMIKGASETVANMLEDYAMYHENQLAVLIRNGQQIHISWLDADKINVSDDNVFFRPGLQDGTEEDAIEEKDPFLRRMREERRTEQEKKARKEVLSRWFFFAVLQGVLDNTLLLSLPEKVSITDMDSPYVVFSTAEGWIPESRYSSFADMLQKSENIPFKKGDFVMTGMGIERDDRRSGRTAGAWDNNRGIGSKNRTWGVSLPGKTLLPINKVIPNIRVKYTVQICRARIEMDPEGLVMYEYDEGKTRSSYPDRNRDDAVIVKYPSYTAVYTDDAVGTENMERIIEGDEWHDYAAALETESYKKLPEKYLLRMSNVYEKNIFYIDKEGKECSIPGFDTGKNAYEAQEAGKELLYRKAVSAEVIGETGYQYYCQAKGGGYRSGHTVNFRVYEHEVIPVTFLCSSWIRSVIAGGNIGSNYTLCGRSMSYSDMLPYLHKILVHLEEREKTEKQMIVSAGGKKWLSDLPDWDAILCEWKIMNGIHVLTETRAKRFVRYLESEEKYGENNW